MSYADIASWIALLIAIIATMFPAMERALQEIFQELEACEEQDGQREDELIRKVKAYIVGHITEDISLESISEKFYLSQYYFSRIFKKNTGVTPTEYRERERG